MDRLRRSGRIGLAGVLAVWLAASGCVSEVGYVPESVKRRSMKDQAGYRPSYSEVKEWAITVADGYDSRSTASRQSMNFSALLAGAGAAAVTMLNVFAPGTSAITGVPIGTAFASGTGAIYSSEPKALIYRYASDTIKELVRLSDVRVEGKEYPPKAGDLANAKEFEKQAMCLEGNVYNVMRRVGEYVALLEPSNVTARVKAAGGTSDTTALQKLADDTKSDYTDLKWVAQGCPEGLTVSDVTTPADGKAEVPGPPSAATHVAPTARPRVRTIEPGASITLNVTGGGRPYTAAATDAASTAALTVSPPVNHGDGAVVAVRAQDGAKPGTYGAIVRDSAGASSVVLFDVGTYATFTATRVGWQSPIDAKKDATVGWVVTGGSRRYVSRGAAPGSEEGIEVIPVSGDPLSPPSYILTVKLKETAQPGHTYTAIIEDERGQRQVLHVTLKAEALKATLIPPGRTSEARPGESLHVVVAGGKPPYIAAGAGREALEVTVPDANHIVRVKVPETAQIGRDYVARITDSAAVRSHTDVRVRAVGEPVDLRVVPVLDEAAAKQAQVALGLTGDDVDGKVGPHTLAAVARYQAVNKLARTGKLDVETLCALRVVVPQRGAVALRCS